MIRIARAPLPNELNGRLSALTAEIAKVELAQRVAAARKLWRRKSTRAQVHHRLDSVLRQMAPGLERCMYCGDNQGTDIDHLSLTLSFGRYVPLTDKGEVTIEVCDLNRPLLQRGRVNSRTNVESSLLRWSSAHRSGDLLIRKTAKRTFSDDYGSE